MPLSDIPCFCVGASYHTVDLDLLERLALSAEAVDAILRACAAAPGEGLARSELVVLSTCNRTEIYAIADPGAPGHGTGALSSLPESLVWALEERAGMPRDLLSPHLFRHEGWAAVEHLYRVVCGLDSLILGESQIVGQVSRAYAAAQQAGTAGAVISLLFQAVIRGGRRVRARTAIGRGAASAASLAVQRAESLAGSLTEASVLVMGTGEMGRLTLHALRERRAGRIDVVSRSVDRASVAARRWGATAHPLSHIPRLLESVDVVICSSSAPSPLVTAAMLEAAMRIRRGRPLTLIDIAVPRSIEPLSAGIPGVRLLNIDSLKESGDAGAGVREIPRVEQIIREELASLALLMAEQDLRPVIGGLWRKADRIRAEVLEHTRSRVPQLDDRSWEHIERLASALVAKLLHEPATRLRAEAGNGHARAYADALLHLFALNVPPGGEH